jgi:hypothetical protein
MIDTAIPDSLAKSLSAVTRSSAEVLPFSQLSMMSADTLDIG